MIEKVSMYHPDKLCDRIAGAILDYCYSQQENPKVAVEVLLGHGLCTVIVESSVELTRFVIKPIVDRITGDPETRLKLISVPQDEHLADNQKDGVRAGDNGIFKGCPLTSEEMELSTFTRWMDNRYPTDGKYILDEKSHRLIVCQSHCDSVQLKKELEEKYPQYEITVNPLGDWTGGSNVDTGACNRKLGSDMGASVTGGGINGKCLTKADLSVNLYAFLEAQRTGKPQEFYCAIGDRDINGIPFSEMVKKSKEYIDSIGGFEEFSCYGWV